MKNYKDMADAVFARRDEYVASVKRKKKIALNASLSLCTICLAVLGAFGIWKSGVLTPDPNVIGTKPHSYTEPTEVTLSGNATSQGEHSDTAEHIPGNTKPQGTTGNVKPEGTNPTEDSKPQPTDPAERPTLPIIGPNSPALKPTLPIIKPTLPTVKPTTPVVLPTLPSVIVTDPVVTEPIEGNPTPDLPITSPDSPEHDRPATNNPTKPQEPGTVPDVTTPAPPPPATNATDSDEPEGEIPPQWYPPTEPLVTEPCWTESTEPTAAPETQAPMEPTLPGDIARPDEATVVEGVVVDQYGNPVEGAVIMVYSGGKLAGTYTTGSNGYYCISGFRNYPPNLGYGSDEGNYIGFSSLPDGYSEVQHSKNFSGSYNYIVLTCNKN